MKYNKKVIMQRAWIMVKTFGLSLSVALKGAWALAKALIAAEKEGKESGWSDLEIGYIDNMTGALVAA